MTKLLSAAATAALLCCVTSTAIGATSSYRGYASYYSMGRKTANGEHFNPMGMTAAHRSLPFGTKVKVTNTRNGRSVVVRINDRGPFVRSRIIDLSLGAAQAVGLKQAGVGKVELLVLN